MKFVVAISAIISVILLFIGLYFDIIDDPMRDKFYGFGTIGVFLITFPLFLFWRRNHTSINKYVLKRNNTTDDIDVDKKN